MKKWMLTTIVLSLITTASFSQFRLGVKAGSNLSKVSGKSFSEEFDLGYQLGAFSEIDFGRFGIQPEVLFSQINTKRSSGFNAIYDSLANRNSGDKINLKYLSIPLLLRYNLSKVVTLNLGPSFSVLIDDNENMLRNGENAFKKGDLSMVGGLALNLKAFRVYGRYNIGLSNINDIDNQDKWKSEQLQLGIGLKL